MSIPTNRPLDASASSGEVTPAQLAAAWKKRGGFDSLRKQLLADFLTAPEKDKFLSDLDVSLPALLASTPSIARQDKKDRPAAVIRSMKQIETLKPQTKALEKRLRQDDGLSRRIQAELRRSLCELKGVPYIEDSQPEAPLVTPSRDEAPAAPEEEAGGGSSRGESERLSADVLPTVWAELSPAAPSGPNNSTNDTVAQSTLASRVDDVPETSHRADTQSDALQERADLPKQEPESAAAETPSTGKGFAASPGATMDVDIKPGPGDAQAPDAPLTGDDDADVDMKPVPTEPSS
ncbi:hypothetical protein BMF94_5117 [Rhodotorula taiwanensis]|uniref:BOD1/SHG1 domain-containing protein n=1 Tax=Rhodotorula taiwanensis TaxID=741276 RepID=A0A2S5B4R9_9BASI|nr:hypothetical protein BMF94_5117 [Rhodotorula taiwanensis]